MRTSHLLLVLALSLPSVARAQPASSPSSLTVTKAELLALNIPFYCDRVARNMHRANSHDERVVLYRVELSNGIVGWGESPPNMPPAKVKDVIGQNPFALMNDDRIGFGLQMALFDAAGKALGVPAHGLLGTKVRDAVPFAWWAIDMPPEDWAAEVAESVKRGYTSAKLKARPWRDLFAQLDAVATVAPKGYQVALDYNGFLHTADEALPILKELETNPLVWGHESPFYFATDLPGVERLAAALNKPVVDHFTEKLAVANAGDGFLIPTNFDGLTRTRRCEGLAVAHNKPYWLQLVGTGITAAFTVHLGAVLPQAKWPAVTCHELWEHDLLKQRLDVKNGQIRVSDAPGLGVEVDETAVAKYRVDPATPTPGALYKKTPRTCRIHIPDDKGGEQVLEFAGEHVYYNEFLKGQHPGFVRGTWLEIVEKD